MTADRRGPKEIAEAKVATAERGLTRARERVTRAQRELEAAREARAAAEAALTYAKQHPLLAPPKQEQPAG